MSWTRMLNAKLIVNGRMILVESKQGCFYRYVIMPDEIISYAIGRKIIYGSFDYDSWKKAQSEGSKLVKNLKM